jgi:hypothetical protein
MTVLTRHTPALGRAAVLAVIALVLLCAGSAVAETVAPLPASAYTTRSACAPPSPGHAACLALALVPRTAEARARTHPLGVIRSHAIAALSPKEGDYGLTPRELHTAYELPSTSGTTQTIALVDAYNDPTAEADLQAYEKEFGLEDCTEPGCFRQVNQTGSEAKANLPFPKTLKALKEARRAEAEEAEGWDVEISLDIEAARATCESCHILLVEANSSSSEELATAEDWAAEHGGADEISNSWGAPENAAIAGAFDHPGVVIAAAAGDDGYLGWDAERPEDRGFVSFPASSPDVVAVGGTRLQRDEGKWHSETVWNDGGESKKGSPDGHGAGGSGCSDIFTAQPWQQSVSDWHEVGCASKRAVADVAVDADPYTGFALYDTTPAPEESATHWYTYGGTSLASPIIASTFALAGGAGGVQYPAETLYQNEKLRPASLNATSGSNGKCSEPFDEATWSTGCTAEREAEASCSLQLICLSHASYDGPTGVGTPHGIEAFRPLSAPETEQLNELEAEERAHAEARAAEERVMAEEDRAAEEQRQAEEARTAEESNKSTATSGTSGSSPGPPSSGAPPATQTTPTPTPTATPTAVRISKLALTLKALLALNHSRPKLSQVGFTFTINAATRVSVSLAKRVRVHGHTRWALLRRAAMIAAIDGRDVRNLSGSGTLGAGAYRLTLTPSHSVGISLVFTLG